MPKINVLVKTEEGQKKIFLRDVNRDTSPWTFTVFREGNAANHVTEHERNCDFEKEAEDYFNLLRSKDSR